MLPVETTYPQFEANQVLSSKHLNDLFEYLDEQNRLTRTNLIGIGIVCGLEVQTAPAGNSITITKGCGVTSQGYLVVLEELVATHFVNYEVPEEVPYPLFYDTTNNQNKYPMWELKPNSTGGATALTSSFLSDKIVLIFVELLEDNLKNCSPNSCDDKGTLVTETFRALLMTKADADKVIAEINAIVGTQTSSDIDKIINAKYYLPEIRFKRFDVPATALVTTDQLVEAYRKLLTKSFIETNLRAALLDAFDAFDLLLDNLDKNIIQNWQVTYGADNEVSLNQPYEYQYFYDFVFDVLETYREIRRKGLDILGICCPDERLFPRHLFLKEAAYNAPHQRKYRHYFMPSPILTNQKILGEELYELFERLLAMLTNFEIPAPTVSGITRQNPYDSNIRITPSKLGDVFLSDKAIPYYYKVNNGTPPLYELWNYRLTREGKAKQNLSYNAPLYATDDFVLKPLEYDLEPYNFLRIEGHVGKDYLLALRTIVHLQQLNRLPFDVVAIKTGNSLDNIEDFHEHECYFQDLEAIYLTLKEELECFACKQIRYFYDLPGLRPVDNPQTLPSQITELGACDANFTYKQGTFGAEFEVVFPQIESGQIPNIITGQVDSTLGYLFVYNLIKVKSSLDDSLAQFVTGNFESFIDYYQKLENAGKTLKAVYNQIVSNPDGPSNSLFVRIEDLIDHIDSILEVCKKDAFEALKKEYDRRIENLQQQLLFSNYAKKHPGIQHKAGVPMGGTFILVYHGNFTPVNVIGGIRDVFLANTIKDIFTNVNLAENDKNVLIANLQQSFDKNFSNVITSNPVNTTVGPNIINTPIQPGRTIFNPPGGLNIPGRPGVITPRDPNDQPPELEEGTVIADFYLPYLCCSDCPPVQYIFPEPPPVQTDALTVTQGDPECTADGSKFNEVCTIAGGTPPYAVDGAAVTGNTFTASFASGQGGDVKVTDSAGAEVTVTVAPHTCEPPCNKPCGGKAERCHYLLWMSKPSTDTRISYNFTEVARLQIKDENGQALFDDSLQDIFDQVLSTSNRLITNSVFDSRINRIIKLINDRVAQKLGDADSFILNYTPNESSLLTIEHYTCHTFQLDLLLGFSELNTKVQLRYIYDNQKVAADININSQIEQQFEVPKFGCTLLDKCAGTSKADCQIDVIKDINAQGNREKATLTPSFSPPVDLNTSKLFWVLEWAQPIFSTTATVNATFLNSGFMRVRLLVLDAKGCWDYAEKTIIITN